MGLAGRDQHAELLVLGHADVAHDGAAALGGAVGLADGDPVAPVGHGAAHDLGGQHVALAADAADDDIQRVEFQLFHASSPPSTLMAPLGHSLAQTPQPTQVTGSM